MKLARIKNAKQTAVVGGILLGSATLGFGQAAPTAEAAKLDQLEKENQDLRTRLDSLETLVKKEGIGPGGSTHSLKVLTESTLSGFATASYFYDTSHPPDGHSNGYLWNAHENSFAVNFVKLTLASPAVERSGDKWDAGYRVSLMFGEDAPYVDTGGNVQGLDEIREAYVELNVPIGTGLDVKLGQLISLLNFESGDGGAANPNFSQGNQWYLTGNGPAAGAQLGYTWTDWLSTKVRVQNGLFTGPIDNNPYKTLMGSIDITPDKKTAISLIGFGGREGATYTAAPAPNSSHDWLKGGSLIASRQIFETYNVNAATELDYFNLNVLDETKDWWSIGGWLWMDFTPKFGIALRGDYLDDRKGAGTSGLLGFPVNSGMNLYSATFTLNIRPVPALKVQPEVRYDHTTLPAAFEGKSDRVILGAGASYLF